MNKENCALKLVDEIIQQCRFSDIFALCKRLHSTLVESGLVQRTGPLSTGVLCRSLQRAKISDVV